MKRTLRRILTMALCLLTLAMIVPVRSAEAANACKQISGSSKSTEVFYVSTGSRWIAQKDVIKFTQTKGTMKIQKRGLIGTDDQYKEYPPFSDKSNSNQKMYETYTIKVEKLNNKNKVVSTQKYELDDGSKSIKLDKNSKYRITVTPTFMAFYNKCKNMTWYQWFGLNNNHNPYRGGVLKTLLTRWIPLGWKSHSTWKVSSTKGINDCSFS